MRQAFAVACVIGVLAAGAAAQDLLDFQDSNARGVLKRSREAVGGVETVAHLQSLVITGISRIPGGAGLLECELEIRILLPDRYLRIERASFGEKRSGFSGKNPLSVISERGQTVLPPESVHKQIVESERDRMLQLLLGAAAYLSPKDTRLVQSVSGSLSTEQPQATSEAAAQRRADQRAKEVGNAAPQHQPDSTWTAGFPDQHTIEVSVREGSRFRFTTDGRTSVPARISYVNANHEEVIVTFGERRPTDGLNLPYRVTTTSRGHIIDDLLINEIAVNTLTPATFAR
jgi:hypothetical protein